MELFCTAKSEVGGDTVECQVFMLRPWILKPGTKLEQRREDKPIAVWELVSQNYKLLILKREDGKRGAIEIADRFYTEAPAEDTTVRSEIATIPDAIPNDASPVEPKGKILIFGGKNWKLASPKKWVPCHLNYDPSMGHPLVGELKLAGSSFDVYKLAEGFAAKLKVS